MGVETSDGSTLSGSSFPRTPQNSFANLPSLPSAGQLDDGFEVISQRAEEPTSLLNVDNTAAVAENEEANEDEEDSVSTTNTSSVAKEETSTTTTVVQEVQSI